MNRMCNIRMLFALSPSHHPGTAGVAVCLLIGLALWTLSFETAFEGRFLGMGVIDVIKDLKKQQQRQRHNDDIHNSFRETNVTRRPTWSVTWSNTSIVQKQPESLVNTSRGNPVIDDDSMLDFTGNKTLVFVHFHKSGGTSVCQIMRGRVGTTDEHFRPRQINQNCNLPFSGPGATIYVMAKIPIACSLLHPFSKDRQGVEFARPNFLALEIPFQDEMPCPGFRSFALIRKPLNRLASHMAFEQTPVHLMKSWANDRQPCINNFWLTGYPFINCMVIRQLLGQERYSDTRSIDVNDFERAKVLVDRFDAFIPLEYLEHVRVQDHLRTRVPEYYQALHDSSFQHSLRTNKTALRNVYLPDQELIDILEKENYYEQKLYDYVLAKFGITEKKAGSLLTAP